MSFEIRNVKLGYDIQFEPAPALHQTLVFPGEKRNDDALPDLVKERARMFGEGVVPREAVLDKIVYRAELEALGWRYSINTDAWHDPLARIAASEILAAEEKTNHDYIGPTGPQIDKDGYPTGKQVPVRDEVHERFHQSVGDVMTGKVMPKAMDQMKQAIDKAKAAAPVEKSGIPPKALGYRM